MLVLFLTFTLFLSTKALHLKQESNLNDTFVRIYPDCQGLDRMAQQIVNNHTNNSYLESCQEDPTIQYLHLGPSRKQHALIMCNIHAREVITADICINWASKYLDSKNPNISITMFYVANRRRDDAIKNLTCPRKSYSEIDLNRNFPTQFDFYNASSDFNSEIYPGTQPISQPFTKCLNRVLKKQPLLFLDMHSGQECGLYYQEGYNSRADRQIFQLVYQNVCNKTGRITTLARDDEAINGHIFADAKVRLQMKYSFLIETYNGTKGDCLKGFNPHTQQLKNREVQKWTNGIDIIIEEFRRRQNL